MGGHRSTYTLDADQVENLWRAFHFSELIGLPLQSPATIVWSKTRHGHGDVPQAFIRFKERTHHWLARLGVPWAAVFAHENGQRHGLHTHLLLHLPGLLHEPFAAEFFGWVGGKRKAAVQMGNSSGNGPRGWLRYISKAINPDDHDCRIVAKQYGIVPSEAGQGWLNFKRAGTTENIGWAARARHDLRNLSKAA